MPTLVVRFINAIPYSVALFRGDGVARSSQIAVDMLLSRELSARKIPRRLRDLIYKKDYLIPGQCLHPILQFDSQQIPLGVGGV